MGETVYGRPELNKDMGSKRFLEFYYMDTELTDFCKKNGLDFTGERKELINRIAAFLSGGKTGVSSFVPKNQAAEGAITGDTPIEPDFKYGDVHKEYFKSVIGPDFIEFEDFLLWLESNPGKQYDEAVHIWYIMRDDMGIY